jgi:DNA-binding transcriptional ArsR family regulator
MQTRTPNLLHPVRVRVIEALSRGEVRSPRELAELLGASLGTVAYHVRTLYDAGHLELVDEQRKRGAIEHFYRLARDRREALAAQMHEVWLVAGRSERALRRGL